MERGRKGGGGGGREIHREGTKLERERESHLTLGRGSWAIAHRQYWQLDL